MVKPITALGRNGVQDFLLARASALILLFYSLYLIAAIIILSPLRYDIWSQFFGFWLTQVFTLLALLSILVHAWIGLWQVLTDYVKSAGLRLLLQFIVIIWLVSCFFMGILMTGSVL
ncbi:Succinate dehydrogenase hydrophobic membrane anchor subunit [Vibrio stylophorae]|uniref:Succinate dehydrogenase hydrophobic membrane anchor subunit n=1 Tax=Vibrio stylophorae TaxID=659351 RepID=A0ABM8ZU81_9VIBR|nr:succinate dehydrogenase, hydrophobic membrane anchor protein [Vibrio stylophorae]CAH0533882.1 Succinate dehydrogenase hydrophobic membrane anchor subunit [Vibrio stylophorae]